jgi:hypothetical protein
MPGPDRPVNAPYYDFAVKAWIVGADLAAIRTAAGNPDETARTEEQRDAPRRQGLGGQFGRAQSLIKHARIHAENMLQVLVDYARAGTKDWSAMVSADGMPLPVLSKHPVPWFSTFVVYAAWVSQARRRVWISSGVGWWE